MKVKEEEGRNGKGVEEERRTEGEWGRNGEGGCAH